MPRFQFKELLLQRGEEIFHCLLYSHFLNTLQKKIVFLNNLMFLLRLSLIQLYFHCRFLHLISPLMQYFSYFYVKFTLFTFSPFLE